MKLNHAGRPMTLNEHIFNWFNERHPDQMAECLRNYPDDEPPFDPYGDFDLINYPPARPADIENLQKNMTEIPDFVHVAARSYVYRKG